MGKGSILGLTNDPNVSIAEGIWDLNDQRAAKAANNWPLGTRMEILSTVTDTADAANYTFNNISLGTPSPSRRIFYHTPTDFLPTGNLLFSSTWSTNEGTINSNVVWPELPVGFRVTTEFSIYTGRWFSHLSDIIPISSSTGNVSMTISTNGATCTGVAPSFFALHNIDNTTPIQLESTTGHTLTNFVPGSIAICFQTVYTIAAPVITGSPLTPIFINNYTRFVAGENTRSVIYAVQNDTSSTVTQTLSSSTSATNLRVYRFR